MISRHISRVFKRFLSSFELGSNLRLIIERSFELFDFFDLCAFISFTCSSALILRFSAIPSSTAFVYDFGVGISKCFSNL